MEFLDASLAAYVDAHSAPESDLLKELSKETYRKVLMPRMLSGVLQGNVLRMFSCMMRPERILEIGTFTGYSALCLAEGLSNTGKLITIEVNDERESMIRSYFSRSPKSTQLELLIGNAMDLLDTIEEVFDLVFIDADKINYSNYYDLIFEKVRPGGLILVDNVLWSGKVVSAYENSKIDKDTAALDAFNKKIHADPRIDHVLLPIRDGIMMVRKL